MNNSNKETNREISWTLAKEASLIEILCLVFFICLLAGPLSGLVLSTSSWFAKITTQANVQYQSTQKLAKAVLESSAKIKFLEKELTTQEVELTSLRQQAKETQVLRTMLNLKNSLKCYSAACDVVGHSPNNWYSQIIIDKGKNDNIQPGFAVLNSNGIVGQILEVSNDTSIVRLLTDPQEKVGVIIKKANVTGILVGAYDKAPTINFVPIGSQVDIGDEVVCLGKGGSFPPNHLIGHVSSIARENNGASMLIDVKLAVNIDDLTSVMVVGQSKN